MSSLIKDLRRQLERTVAEARKIAEEGAEQSLKRLAVDAPRPHDALTSEERKLRVSLRAHSKQLGDRLGERPTRLIQAVAYEHWHRLLFARFLIENDLLLHAEHGVALSLDEVKEIALGESRKWVDVAADYAQGMLLRCVFQPEDPALRVALSPEKRLQLEAKLSSLPREVFLADDSLGWVYQFWQRDEKDRVNKSEVKIAADELAPVTQLFTEDYMVEFLLHNTLGAWWAGKIGPIKAATEKEARARAALPERESVPEISWSFLRFVQDAATNTWLPAAGVFDGWPKSASLIRLLDPCMGSGHFLAFALPLLVRLRMEEEKLSARAAVVVVLRDNIYGLELDERCTQIAAFNLALTAWKLAGYQSIPPLHLACSGLAPTGSEADWIALAGNDDRMRRGMMRLHGLFKDAPVLGSLINPRAQGRTLIEAEFHELAPLLERALEEETKDDAAREMAVTARGLAKAAEILAGLFTLVATNVPYLSNRKQCDELKDFCTSHYRDAKNDLAVTFFLRLVQLCEESGSLAFVMSQYWLFKSSYSEVRRELLAKLEWPILAKLGVGAFETISGEVVNVMAGVWNRRPPSPGSQIAGLDAMSFSSPTEKAQALRVENTTRLSQVEQRSNAESRIIIGEISDISTLETVAIAPQGTKTGDDDRWRACMWEIETFNSGWVPYQTTVRGHCLYGGRHLYLDWRTEGVGMIRPRISNLAVGKQGVAISQSGALPATLYTGERFDSNTAPLIPNDPNSIPALWAYCSSEEYLENVRLIDQSLKVTNVPLIQVPFDLAHWKKVAAEKYPQGLPKPFSSDPTQWLFNGHPKGSGEPLQVAVARLLGYKWPRQTGSSFPDCPALSPDGLEKLAEADGIVCLTSLAGKASAADRLRALLADAYREEWSATKLSELLGGSESLEVWLRDRFFEEHCQIFYQRPFIWHVWDGRKDGFHAFVNYHKLEHKVLEKLIYSYLGDWISRQRHDLASGAEGADGRLAAAEHLQNELKSILEGECSKDETHGYDVFVRWKPLNAQPIGWEPDLNDGVRMNIRPWITEARLYRATKPGILRVTPNIKYGKDRGREPKRDSKAYPWLQGTTDRNNDIHIQLNDKRRARGLK
jgi:Eco57I restriction-modification methylase